MSWFIKQEYEAHPGNGVRLFLLDGVEVSGIRFQVSGSSLWVVGGEVALVWPALPPPKASFRPRHPALREIGERRK